MAEADAAPKSVLGERFQKYGVLGAGLCGGFDSMQTLRFAKAQEEQERLVEEAAVAPAPSSEPAAGYTAAEEALAVPKAAPKSITPTGPSPELVEAIIAMAKDLQNPGSGEKLKREHIIEILEETARVQAIVQQEISVLAREMAEAKNGKKKRKPLSFLDGHKKILELNLPHEPLEDHGVSESAFQNLLMQYQEDDEIMIAAGKLLHPAGKGDPSRAKGISIERIVEIHQFMVKEMEKVLNEFRQLPQDTRRSFTSKACETTAELMVSVAVEQQLSVRCEDVEQAVIMYEDALQQHPEFTRCTEHLANAMQHLIGSTQDRVAKAEFLAFLRHMGECNKQAKVFAKNLYEDYRGKKCNIVEAYARFEQFHEEASAPVTELADLSSVEMQLCFEEYQDDSAVKQAWEQSGAEASVALQTMMASHMGIPQQGGAQSSSAIDKKAKKTKPSEIVEMQELMVDELKRLSEATATALKKKDTAGDRVWRPEVAAQMVQALASSAVERRYNVTAEDMAMLGFQHAATLQRNERFVRATEKQQEIIMQQIPNLCQATSPSPTQGATSKASLTDE